MATKSNLNVFIQPDGQPNSISLIADSSGFLTVQVSDGKGASISVPLAQADSRTLTMALNSSNSLRNQIPQS